MAGLYLGIAGPGVNALVSDGLVIALCKAAPVGGHMRLGGRYFQNRRRAVPIEDLALMSWPV